MQESVWCQEAKHISSAVRVCRRLAPRHRRSLVYRAVHTVELRLAAWLADHHEGVFFSSLGEGAVGYPVTREISSLSTREQYARSVREIGRAAVAVAGSCEREGRDVPPCHEIVPSDVTLHSKAPGAKCPRVAVDWARVLLTDLRRFTKTPERALRALLPAAGTTLVSQLVASAVEGRPFHCNKEVPWVQQEGEVLPRPPGTGVALHGSFGMLCSAPACEPHKLLHEGCGFQRGWVLSEPCWSVEGIVPMAASSVAEVIVHAAAPLAHLEALAVPCALSGIVSLRRVKRGSAMKRVHPIERSYAYRLHASVDRIVDALVRTRDMRVPYACLGSVAFLKHALNTKVSIPRPSGIGHLVRAVREAALHTAGERAGPWDCAVDAVLRMLREGGAVDALPVPPQPPLEDVACAMFEAERSDAHAAWSARTLERCCLPVTRFVRDVVRQRQHNSRLTPRRRCPPSPCRSS